MITSPLVIIVEITMCNFILIALKTRLLSKWRQCIRQIEISKLNRQALFRSFKHIRVF